MQPPDSHRSPSSTSQPDPAPPCPCACHSACKKTTSAVSPRTIASGGILLVCWWLTYNNLDPFASWLTHSVLQMTPDTHAAEAVRFFLYESPKVILLLVIIVFAVGIVRSFFTPEKTRQILSGKGEFSGNISAALLGIATPFCTCSAVPLFIGFVSAGVPLGITFSFLISAPMVNEVALVLLLGLFGWKIAALYLGTGLIIAILSGWIIGRLQMEKHIEEWVFEIPASSAATDSPGIDWQQRIHLGTDAVKEIVGKVWPYILAGIAVGAYIHGYVPEDLMASLMGKDAWWSVPLAVLLGVPMYSNVAGIIPVAQALLGKGASLGTVLAFMMSVTALSLPEAIILRKVLKPKLIALFFGTVAISILFIGYLFNLLL